MADAHPDPAPERGDPHRDVIPRPPGERRLKIVDKDLLRAAVNRSVASSLHRRLGELDADVVARIQDDVRERLMRLVHEKGRQLRGMSKKRFLLELERSRNQILRARDEAREQLAGLRARLGSIRTKGPGREALANEEAHLSEQFEVVVRERVRSLFARAATGELDAARMEEEIVALTFRLARDEAERLVERQGGPQLGRVDVLERRILKLTRHLDQAEHAMGELRRLKEGDPGIASIYRHVQGLSDEEADAAIKRVLLREIFEANVALRAALGTV